MEVIKTENGCDMLSWCPEIEDKALEQMRIISCLPFVKRISLMPDCHFGASACIGSVVACKDVVVPQMVGADAACGMSFMKTSLTKSDIEDEDLRKKLHHSFSRSIPVGFKHNDQRRTKQINDMYGTEIDKMIDDSLINSYPEFAVVPLKDIKKGVASQICTLGGG